MFQNVVFVAKWVASCGWWVLFCWAHRVSQLDLSFVGLLRWWNDHWQVQRGIARKFSFRKMARRSSQMKFRGHTCLLLLLFHPLFRFLSSRVFKNSNVGYILKNNNEIQALGKYKEGSWDITNTAGALRLIYIVFSCLIPNGFQLSYSKCLKGFQEVRCRERTVADSTHCIAILL